MLWFTLIVISIVIVAFLTIKWKSEKNDGFKKAASLLSANALVFLYLVIPYLPGDMSPPFPILYGIVGIVEFFAAPFLVYLGLNSFELTSNSKFGLLLLIVVNGLVWFASLLAIAHSFPGIAYVT